jgi:hypothetical protein
MLVYLMGKKKKAWIKKKKGGADTFFLYSQVMAVLLYQNGKIA